MNVLIATPCYGGLVTERYLASLLATLSHRAWSVPVRFQRATVSGEALVTYARNRLAAGFLRSPCDAMLCIDADTEWSPTDVDLLLTADKPLVGGAVPLKTTPTAYAVRGAEGEGELVRAQGVGLAFALIRREVFECLTGTTKKYTDEDGEARDYFASEVSRGRYFSEDLAFCNRYRRAGGEVWAHFGVRLGHVGSHTFRGDPAAHKGQ